MSNATETKILESIRATGATRAGFFGTVTLSFKDGRLCLIRQERTYIPNDFEGSNTKLINDQPKTR